MKPRVSRSHGALPVFPSELAAFQDALLTWFSSARRDLEWRKTRDPYRIWISEVMLQQTRVATVIPYYRRFVERFPTLRHLAKAPISSVLTHWSGLGYYSRARNLHAAAKQIVKLHNGKFPEVPAAVQSLPGIGPYTAAAVLSIAFDKPAAVLDGNVARVLARLGVVSGDLREPKRWKQLGRTAEALLALQAPGDWNQAMMELGATVCTPRSPACASCPVSHWCGAHATGSADTLPSPRSKPRRVHITLIAAVLLDPRGRTLLVRPADDGESLFSKLWQFPAVRVKRATNRQALLQELSRELLSTLGLSEEVAPASKHALSVVSHTVTFRRVRIHPFLIPVERLPSTKESRTPLLAQLDSLPISNATRKIATVARRSV